VESGQIKWITQHVENDASPLFLDSSISLRMTSVVTQCQHQVHEEEDTEDVLIEDPEP